MTKSSSETLGEIIKDFRVERNISQERLARKAGVSRLTISRIERGEQSASLNTAVKIARAIAFKLDELQGDV